MAFLERKVAGIGEKEPMKITVGENEYIRRDLISPPVVQQNGSVTIPQAPGLGIEINPDVLKRDAL